MNKINELKRILPGIQDSVQLRKESTKSLCGPCPRCGGDDRFVYRTDKKRFFCRQCNEKGGDVITFHKWIEGTGVKGLFKKYLPNNSQPIPKKKSTSKPFVHYKLGSPLEKYPYTDAKGNTLYFNCRFNPKAFRQCSANGRSWAVKNIETKVPYLLPKVIEEKTVFIVEGEKDCHNLAKLNFIGTCNVGGAGNWTPDLNKHFKGKEVYLVPDNDKPGRKHIANVYDNLKDIATNIKVIELPGLPERGDFTDWMNIFDDIDEAGERFAIMVEGAEPYEPPKKVTLDDSILEIGQFCDLNVRVRYEYLSPWIKEGCIGLISGWRGVGKTFFLMGILDAVSSGKSFGPWECKVSVPCLLLDGEMPREDVIERSRHLGLTSKRQNPFYIYSDAHSSQMGLSRAHLTNEVWRQKMKQILLTRQVRLWAIDNLASLASGLDENKKQDWDPINSWLLELRFAGISTIMLHHVNKDGGQRGTSAREDNLDVSLLLKPPHDYTPDDGARFITHFTKARVPTRYLHLISDTEFKIIQDEHGKYVWTYGNVKLERKKEVIKMINGGFDQKAIVESLDISKGYVSKLKKQAIKDGFLTANCKLTPLGFDYVSG